MTSTQDAIGANEVAGHTLATLISAGTELNSGYLGDNFPRQSGYAAAFKVEKVGENVSGISPGDLAFCPGNHASYQRKPASQVIRLPDGLAPEISTFARMMGVSMTTLTTTSARPPAKILITGLGLVGHLAAKNFQACGYEVYACDPVASRRQIASETGIHNVLDAVPSENSDLTGQFHLAIECSGHEQALLDAAGAVRKRAEVVCIASPWRRYTDLLIHDLHRLIFFNYVTIRSGWEWNCRASQKTFAPTAFLKTSPVPSNGWPRAASMSRASTQRTIPKDASKPIVTSCTKTPNASPSSLTGRRKHVGATLVAACFSTSQIRIRNMGRPNETGMYSPVFWRFVPGIINGWQKRDAGDLCDWAVCSAGFGNGGT